MIDLAVIILHSLRMPANDPELLFFLYEEQPNCNNDAPKRLRSDRACASASAVYLFYL